MKDDKMQRQFVVFALPILLYEESKKQDQKELVF